MDSKQKMKIMKLVMIMMILGFSKKNMIKSA